MSHVKPWSSTTDDARPPGWSDASYRSQFVCPSSLQPPRRAEAGRPGADDHDRGSAGISAKHRRNASICAKRSRAELEQLAAADRDLARIALLVHHVDVGDVETPRRLRRSPETATAPACRRGCSGGLLPDRPAQQLVRDVGVEEPHAEQQRITARMNFDEMQPSGGIVPAPPYAEHAVAASLDVRPTPPETSSSGIWRSLSMSSTYCREPRRARPSARRRGRGSPDG